MILELDPIRLLIRLTYFLWLLLSLLVVVSAKKPHVQLEQHHVNIDLERNRRTSFFYQELDTDIQVTWRDLPEAPTPSDIDCKIGLPINLEPFELPLSTICLYKCACDDHIFSNDSSINIFGTEYGTQALHEVSQRVRGVVKGDPYSKVTGYMVNEYFYGQLRLFDMFRLHHVVFYIEPKKYLELYDPAGEGKGGVVPRENEGNAIIFEYISRVSRQPPPKAEDYDDSAVAGPPEPPAPSKPAKPSARLDIFPVPEKVFSEKPSAPSVPSEIIPEPSMPSPFMPRVLAPEPSMPSETIPMSSRPSKRPKKPFKPQEMSPAAPAVPSDISPVVPENPPASPVLSEPPEPSVPSENSPKPSRPPRLSTPFKAKPPVRASERKKRQTKDQEAYSHENILNADDDVIHSYRFKGGRVEHDLFDMRREDASICKLCIWIQPHFAQVFGFDQNVETGASEVLDLIQHLNWAFRTLDFDQDGLPENIGFQVSKLVVNDEVRVTTTGSPKQHSPARAPEYEIEEGGGAGNEKLYSFSTNINTISTKSALALGTKHMSTVFSHEACCAFIGFVYHNMAPAISTTNLRGLCTGKNVAIVSGFYGSSKLGKFDVFRGLFHAVTHLFGGHHDDVTNPRCLGNFRTRFLNPFPMHPVQQLNIGLRSGSLSLSPCSKDHITQFLASKGAHCLVQVQENFCGNGIVDDGEACDCGSLWQCHSQEECCGEGDTLAGCRILDPHKKECLRPLEW